MTELTPQDVKELQKGLSELTVQEMQEAKAWSDWQREQEERRLLRESGVCENCKQHKATINWTGTEGIMAFARGHYSRWCRCCAVKVQHAYAVEAAARVEHLRALMVMSCEEQEASEKALEEVDVPSGPNRKG